MYNGGFSNTLIRKLKEYREKFNDVFPTMMYSGTEEELINEIDKCISTGKKYDISFWLDDEIDC